MVGIFPKKTTRSTTRIYQTWLRRLNKKDELEKRLLSQERIRVSKVDRETGRYRTDPEMESITRDRTKDLAEEILENSEEMNYQDERESVRNSDARFLWAKSLKGVSSALPGVGEGKQRQASMHRKRQLKARCFFFSARPFMLYRHRYLPLSLVGLSFSHPPLSLSRREVADWTRGTEKSRGPSCFFSTGR